VQPWACCKHTCTSVTKQYNLVPANGQWCLAKSSIALANTSQTLVVLHLRAHLLQHGRLYLYLVQKITLITGSSVNHSLLNKAVVLCLNNAMMQIHVFLRIGSNGVPTST